MEDGRVHVALVADAERVERRIDGRGGIHALF